MADPNDAESVRKAAEAALQQARNALDEASTAAEKAVDSLKGAGTPALQDAIRASLAYAGEVTDDAFDYLKRLLAARRPEDVVAAQQAFFTRQMTEAAGRARRLTEAAMKLGGAGSPFGTR